MATTGSIIVIDNGSYANPGIQRVVEIDWTNDASAGTVSGWPTINLTGVLVGIRIVGPTNTATVTLKDAQGVDVLAGLGTGVISSSVVEDAPLTATNKVYFVLFGAYTFAVASGTNSQTGKLFLLLR